MLQRVLVTADEVALRRRFERLLRGEGTVVTSSAPEALWSRLGRETYDLVVAADDAVPTPVAPSIEALRSLPEPPEVVILLRRAEPARRVEFQQAGVLAVLDAELDDERLGRALDTLREDAAQRSRQAAALEREQGRHSLGDFSSRSAAMQAVLDLARRVAEGDASLLVLGETGVGKEWLSRAIHDASRRSAGPFVAVNCAAIPDSMLESELFGHEQGAFTGAHRAHRGYFEQAHGGSLFLDEIGEMPAGLQTRLLRVLQDSKVRRLGSESSQKVDVRVIAATNRDVASSVESGVLRQDLFYRLAVVTLELPPLRERREDIAPLFLSHVERHGAETSRSDIRGVSDEALEALTHYDWPGNVRELINVAERSVLLSDGPLIERHDLPPPMNHGGSAPSAPPAPAESLFSLPLDEARETVVDDFERQYLERLLQRERGRMAQTAAAAGISTRTLYNKMQRLGISKRAFKG